MMNWCLSAGAHCQDAADELKDWSELTNQRLLANFPSPNIPRGNRPRWLSWDKELPAPFRATPRSQDSHRSLPTPPNYFYEGYNACSAPMIGGQISVWVGQIVKENISALRGQQIFGWDSIHIRHEAFKKEYGSWRLTLGTHATVEHTCTSVWKICCLKSDFYSFNQARMRIKLVVLCNPGVW